MLRDWSELSTKFVITTWTRLVCKLVAKCPMPSRHMPITFKPDMKNGDNKLLQKYEAAGKPEKRHSLLAHVETRYDLGKFEEKIVKHVISLANTNGTRWMTWGELCQTTSRRQAKQDVLNNKYEVTHNVFGDKLYKKVQGCTRP